MSPIYLSWAVSHAVRARLSANQSAVSSLPANQSPARPTWLQLCPSPPVSSSESVWQISALNFSPSNSPQLSLAGMTMT